MWRFGGYYLVDRNDNRFCSHCSELLLARVHPTGGESGGGPSTATGSGRLVKRLVDLETYRMAALLGLPVVRQSTPALQSLEVRTGVAMRALSTSEDEALAASIREISALLAEVGALREGLRYRIAASKAYYDIVSDRLASLAEAPIGQRQTLKGFVDHRLRRSNRTVEQA